MQGRGHPARGIKASIPVCIMELLQLSGAIIATMRAAKRCPYKGLQQRLHRATKKRTVKRYRFLQFAFRGK